MSIFDKHKDGRARSSFFPVDVKREEALVAQFDEAVARQDWHSAWRYYREIGYQQDTGRHVTDNPDVILPLACYLSEENHPDDALSLLNGFAARYPAHPDVVKNYLLAVNIMRRDFGDHAGARELLERLAQTYPEHPDYPLIQQAQERST